MKQLAILLILIFFSTQLFAQAMTNEQIENDLNKQFEQIKSLPYGGGDSLFYHDSLFRKKFAYYTAHYPSTLAYPFNLLQKDYNISIVTSKDKRFRIYSWDNRLGGTMHSFSNVFQFKAGDQVYSKLSADTGTDANYDPGVSYGKIYTLKTSQRTYYLAFGEGTYSTIITGQRFKVFSIENHSLNDTVKLIKKKNGQLVNQLTVSINLFLNYPGSDTADTYGEYINFMEYDPKKKTLIAPVIDHRKDSATARSEIFQFNGKYFKYIKTKDTAK